jgi:RHS repeat-associated protein
VTLGSGDSDTFQFDPTTGRMTQYLASVAGSTQKGALTWNANGTLGNLAITDALGSSSQTCTYTHDDLTRIAQANCGTAWNQTFTFDPFGNLKKAGSVAWTPTDSSATNGYSSIPTGTLSYDANGNDLSDGFHTYTWDADGNMISIDGNPLNYDAFDRRIEQTVSGNSTEFLFGPGGTRLASMTAQTVGKLDLPLPGGDAAVYFSVGLTYYRHSDWLGSSRLASWPSPSTAYFDKSYAPFGEIYNETGTSERSFTGQDNDLTTGSYDFPFREYDPTQGRWLQPDPAGVNAVDVTNPKSWNRYGYVLGNPLGLVDPTGMYAEAPPTVQTAPSDFCTTFITGQEAVPVTPAANPCTGGIFYMAYSGALPSGGQRTGSSNSGSPASNAGSPAKTGPTIGPARPAYTQILPCVKQQYGLLATGAAMTALGQPIAGTKPFVTPGIYGTTSSKGTSAASWLFRNLLGGLKLSQRVLTPVGGAFTGRAFEMAATRDAGAVLGRWVPFVGEALIVYDVGKIGSCVVNGLDTWKPAPAYVDTGVGW